MKTQTASGSPPLRASRQTLTLEVEGSSRSLELVADQGKNSWLVLLDGINFEVDARLLEPGVLSLIVEGSVYRCLLDAGPLETGVTIEGERVVVALDDPRSLAARRQRRSAVGGQQVIKAPMPGRIVRVMTAIGQAVQAHHPVVAIEAMKMQNELKALRAGTVREVRIQAGQTVAAGETLLVIE